MAIRYAAKDPTTGIRVTLISSPVQGSVACRYAGFIPGMASLFPILADMSPDSKFVTEGQKMLGDLLDKTTCMYCKVDGVIWPASSCYVDGAHRIIRLPDGVNHVTEIQDSRVVEQIGRIHARYVMAA